MSITTIAKRLTTLRTIAANTDATERAGHARLLAACFPTPAKELQFSNGDPIPSINPYSIIWNLIETDERRWN